jgi:hypothetical protein
VNAAPTGFAKEQTENEKGRWPSDTKTDLWAKLHVLGELLLIPLWDEENSEQNLDFGGN